MVTRGRSSGFTLLELLVALAIASFMLMGVYRVVDGVVHGQRVLEKRYEQLHLWLYVRRILQQDLAQRLSQSDDTLVRGAVLDLSAPPTRVTLRCTGGVAPGRTLGPAVDVVYGWEERSDGHGVIWTRLLRAVASDRVAPGLTMQITDGLEAVAFALLDKTGWKGLEDDLDPPVRAIRWQFRWSLIGSWTLVQPF